MVFPKKAQVSLPLPVQANKEGLVYLNEVIQYIELIQNKKAGISKNKAEAAFDLLIDAIVKANESYDRYPEAIRETKLDAVVNLVMEKAGPHTKLGEWFSKKPQSKEGYAKLMSMDYYAEAASAIQQKQFSEKKQDKFSEAFTKASGEMMAYQRKICERFKQVITSTLGPMSESEKNKGLAKDNEPEDTNSYRN